MCRRGALVWCLSVMAGLSACTQLEDVNSGQCVPECGPNLRCIEGQCQPILCTESSECILGQICHEGRCAASCDGETHCPSATCEEGLCVGTMECASGDVRDCMTACGAGIERCTNSMWSLCSAGVPSAQDACGDGVDGDCDGEVDEACPACQPDERQPCENDCGSGEQVCEEGVWSLCSTPPPNGAGECPCVAETSEVCDTPCGRGRRVCDNGVFGQCLFDGEVCECAPGDSEACDTACGVGQRVCRDGRWSACNGPDPAAELCGNGLDEDCDGNPDEGCAACSVDFIDSPSIVSALDSRFQDVPTAALNSSVWMAYFRDRDGRRVSAYATYRVSRDDFRLTGAFESELNTAHTLSTNNSFIIGVGQSPDRSIGVEVVSGSGIRRRESVRADGPFEHYFALGNTPTLHAVYRVANDGLYLQSLPEDSGPPPRLRLGNASRFGLYPTLDSQGLNIVYESEEGNFAEGRALAVMRVQLSPNRLLSDERLVDPRTEGPLFGNDPIAYFANDRYLLVYTRRVEGHFRLFSTQTDLDGRLLSPPREIYRAPAGLIVTRPKLAGVGNRRLLVWAEYERLDTGTEIKYMGLDPSGAPSSPVVPVYSGLVSMPNIAWPPAGKPVLTWTQEEAVELGQLVSLKIATVPADPTCD